MSLRIARGDHFQLHARQASRTWSHAVGARVLRNTMAQVALSRVDERTKALSAVMIELLGADEARRRFAAEMSGLAIRYDLCEGHPLLGCRIPDLDLVTARGPLRVFTLLHDARPLLLNFGQNGAIDIGGWADRVWRIDARCDGPWELPRSVRNRHRAPCSCDPTAMSRGSATARRTGSRCGSGQRSRRIRTRGRRWLNPTANR